MVGDEFSFLRGLSRIGALDMVEENNGFYFVLERGREGERERGRERERERE